MLINILSIATAATIAYTLALIITFSILHMSLYSKYSSMSMTNLCSTMGITANDEIVLYGILVFRLTRPRPVAIIMKGDSVVVCYKNGTRREYAGLDSGLWIVRPLDKRSVNSQRYLTMYRSRRSRWPRFNMALLPHSEDILPEWSPNAHALSRDGRLLRSIDRRLDLAPQLGDRKPSGNGDSFNL